MAFAADMSVFEQSKKTRALHLSGRSLTEVPPAVLAMTDIVRLDLGGNEITALPAALAGLTRLEELWLNGNPIKTIPPSLQHCRALKVLDLRGTKVYELPRELSRLPNLVDIDLRGVKLEPRLQQAYLGGTDSLLAELKDRDTRTELQLKLERRLREGVYREVADTAEGNELIPALVRTVFIEFTDFDEIKSLIRNTERLFPADLVVADAKAIRALFVRLKRENRMKKLAAEVELKIRAIYFNRIKPESVEGIVKSIYEEITTLEDIRFLLFFATQLFPPTAKEIDAKRLKQDLMGLRQKLREEREAAVKSVEMALRALYSDQEPAKVRAVTEQCVAYFKRVEDLKKLAADAGEIFPAEFSSVKPHRVHRKFVKLREDEAAQ